MNVSIEWTKPDGETKQVDTTTEKIKTLSDDLNMSDTRIGEEVFLSYKIYYLTKAEPSQKACWERAVGECKRVYPDLKGKIPSASACRRRLKAEYPESAIYCARHGSEAWERKYLTGRKIVTIQRNGIRDLKTGNYYWSDWMVLYRGRKVYLGYSLGKRIHVYAADKGNHLGDATLTKPVPALVDTDEAKARVKEVIAGQKKINALASGR